MKKLVTSVKQFIASEDGPTAVEYAVMLALIIVVCLAAVSAVGSRANTKFNKVASFLT
ncbi:MAG: Flp family type IVb pilin [Planctomycetota bacterium]|jgi:pilus assembly protein Flp/PilA|nr:MAG: Flp family type IVb pilin [Planctomycetota bacterium]